jgi:hypothetical protein
MLCASSIKSLEGGRWRLRGCGLTADPNLTAMGIESFFVCSLLIVRDLQKSEKAKIAVKSATLRHDVLSLAREASAAPAATFLTSKPEVEPPRAGRAKSIAECWDNVLYHSLPRMGKPARSLETGARNSLKRLAAAMGVRCCS